MNNHTVSIPALSTKEYMEALQRQQGQQAQDQAVEPGSITVIENCVEAVECVTDWKALTKKIIFTGLRALRGDYK
tara:strand:+ start:66 stop:290 length:225 start_codon:yes stop_codon:yes gene_type:complete